GHVLGETEPVEGVRGQREQIRQLADRRERRTAEELDRHAAAVLLQAELHRLRRAREIGDAENRLVAELAQVRQYLAVPGRQEREAAAAEGVARLSHGEHAL